MWKKITNWIASIPLIFVAGMVFGMSVLMFGMGVGFLVFGFHHVAYTCGVIAVCFVFLGIIMVRWSE